MTLLNAFFFFWHVNVHVYVYVGGYGCFLPIFLTEKASRWIWRSLIWLEWLSSWDLASTSTVLRGHSIGDTPRLSHLPSPQTQFLNRYLCMYTIYKASVWMYTTCGVHAYRSQKRALNPLWWEVEQPWATPCVRALTRNWTWVNVFNHRAIFLDPQMQF